MKTILFTNVLFLFVIGKVCQSLSTSIRQSGLFSKRLVVFQSFIHLEPVL